MESDTVGPPCEWHRRVPGGLFHRAQSGGVALVAAAVGAVVAGRRVVAFGAALAGAGLLFNAATQFCGVNALLGVDTCSRE